MELNGAKIVSSAMLGLDIRTILVNDRCYVLNPPTIHKIAGAAYWLSDVKPAETIVDVIKTLENVDNAAHALSWFIADNDSLYDELSKGTLDEVVEGIQTAFSLISAQNFMMLSTLSQSVQSLIAKQKS